MNIGDRVKGFEFAEQRRALFVAMTTPMYNLIGVDGTIVEIDHDNGSFKIEFGNKNVDNGTSAWWYPIEIQSITKYLVEEALKREVATPPST